MQLEKPADPLPLRCPLEPASKDVNDEALRHVPHMNDIYSSEEKCIQWYGSVSPAVYEETMRLVNFCDPYNIAAQVHNKQIDGGINLPRTAKILDIGCGTGLVARILSREGFKDITGVDASANFLKIAAGDGNYKSLHELFLGRGIEVFKEEIKENFDCVTASGVFLSGHMPKDALDDAHAALNKGGIFVTAMREIYWENGNSHGYKDKLDDMIEKGKFELLKSAQFMRGEEHLTGLFAPLPSILLVLRRVD